MYGTISRIKVRPENWEEFQRTARRGPQPQGARAMMVFQMDADPSEFFVVAMAESEEAYRALSESPEMHEAYLERRRMYESEPEWHDGRVLLLRHHPVPHDAQLYGSIAEMQLKPGAYACEWHNVSNGKRTGGKTVHARAPKTRLVPPFTGPAVAYLKNIRTAKNPCALRPGSTNRGKSEAE